MKCEAETPPFSDFLGTLCLGLAVCLECSEGGIRQGSGYAGLRLREDFGIDYVQGNPWSALTEESTISGCAENGGGAAVSVWRLLESPGEQPPALPSRWAYLFKVPLLSCLSLELGNHA